MSEIYTSMLSENFTTERIIQLCFYRDHGIKMNVCNNRKRLYSETTGKKAQKKDSELLGDACTEELQNKVTVTEHDLKGVSENDNTRVATHISLEKTETTNEIGANKQYISRKSETDGENYIEDDDDDIEDNKSEDDIENGVDADGSDVDDESNSETDTVDDVENDIYQKNRSCSAHGYIVYLLQSETKPKTTYCGITNRKSRRIRQHNGEISGGAKRTRGRGPWRMYAIVTGFIDKRDALRFEWSVHNPRKRRLRTPHYGRNGRLNVCKQLLMQEPWINYNRRLRLYLHRSDLCLSRVEHLERECTLEFTAGSRL